MLKRFYVDNYRCLSNFDYQPRPIELLIGANGSGKSTVFGVLADLTRVVRDGCPVTRAFPAETRTRWNSRREQAFELEVGLDQGTLTYRLEVQHDDTKRTCRVLRERLADESGPLFEFSDGQVQLYRDDHSEGPVYGANWEMSALYTVPGGRPDNTKLTAFKRWLAGVWVLKLDPTRMAADSEREEPDLRRDGSNFASWYRHCVQQNPGRVLMLSEDLRSIWPPFTELRSVNVGEHARNLRLTLGREGGPDDYAFDELSDGERALIVLYSLKAFALDTVRLLCFDEPSSYLALAELQPWWNAFRDAAEEAAVQVLLTTHNSELLNLLAPEDAVVLRRENGGPTRPGPFPTDFEGALTPAEVVARGWVDG